MRHILYFSGCLPGTLEVGGLWTLPRKLHVFETMVYSRVSKCGYVQPSTFLVYSRIHKAILHIKPYYRAQAGWFILDSVWADQIHRPINRICGVVYPYSLKNYLSVVKQCLFAASDFEQKLHYFFGGNPLANFSPLKPKFQQSWDKVTFSLHMWTILHIL